MSSSSDRLLRKVSLKDWRSLETQLIDWVVVAVVVEDSVGLGLLRKMDGSDEGCRCG